MLAKLGPVEDVLGRGILSLRELQDRVRRPDMPRKEPSGHYMQEGSLRLGRKGGGWAVIFHVSGAAEQTIYQDVGDRSLKGKIFACVCFFPK